ncbi:hypothetical protein PGH07_01145 [Sulfurovum sp. zt1-1]|uniref:Uncharacterized protein n=1 Tax=Sulfurovum zhangzhouensis TaxID=3019067 RepID=A0ABT7QVB5_9BACT|nr:hypothetical protein [Sulfurovum zhangzhouensis]MDM5270777.1 hypothetical protein [Sulfurovum zhangzhouensis]
MSKKSKGFVKKYWVYIIIVTMLLIIAAISIDVWYSDGNIIAKQINIFENNSTKIVNTYKYEYEYPFLKVLSIFLYSFAMSLLISLFILKVIQKDDDKIREKKDERRKDELFRNVFSGVFNRLVPNEIFDAIKSDILQAQVIRKNVRWIYDFKVEDGQLVLYRNVMYELHNISKKNAKELFSYIYSATDYTETSILFLKWHKNGDIENTFVAYDISEHDESTLEHLEKSGDYEQVKHDIEVIPDEIINLNFKSKEIFKNNSKFIHEAHFSTACSIGWELEVNYPEGYEFGIIPMFNANLIPIVDDVDRKKYEYSGAILVGQGIEFTLKCKNIE